MLKAPLLAVQPPQRTGVVDLKALKVYLTVSQDTKTPLARY